MTLQDALIKQGLATEVQLPKPEDETSSNPGIGKLTPEQVQHWRMVLMMNPQIGAYALIMPEEEINAIRGHLFAGCSPANKN